MFAKMAGFKAEPLNIFENGNHQVTNSYDKRLEFIVEWILPKIIVQVSNQMNKTLLLRTGESIIS